MKSRITEQSLAINRHVAKNIQRMRKARGMTARETAELLGITKEITKGALEVYRTWQISSPHKD